MTSSITSDVLKATSTSSIMNEELKGEVYGVGKSSSIGFIHSCDLCIENEYFPVHFQGFDWINSSLVMPKFSLRGSCLLGLDFLKEYHGVIDLVNNTLTLEVNGKKIVTKLVAGYVCC